MKNLLRILINLQVELLQKTILHQKALMCRSFDGCRNCPYYSEGFPKTCWLTDAFVNSGLAWIHRKDFKGEDV